MNRKKKTVLKGFDYMHCDDFARYLEDMAAKGWHFREWGVGLKFEQGEPEDATYAVEVFTKASENDLRPTPDAEEFADYCEAAGWKFIDAKQKFCIFKKIEEDAAELFTPEERVANACKGMFSGSAIALLVLYGINMLLQIFNIVSFFERNIFSSATMFSLSTWTVLFLGQLCCFGYALWKRQSLYRTIKRGERIYIGNQRKGKLSVRIRDIYITLLTFMLIAYQAMLGKTELVVLCVGCFVITIVFAIILAKLRPDSSTNTGIQVVFSIVYLIIVVVASVAIISGDEDTAMRKDELPLQITDYREMDGVRESISIYQDRNLLGSCENYFIFTEKESIYYHIYRSRHDWILDRIWEEELDARYNEDAVNCTELWEAQKALRNRVGTYYVRYDGVVLVFNEDEDIDLTPEQIGIIWEKLDIR